MSDISKGEWTVIKCIFYQEMKKYKVDGPIYPMLNSIYQKILYKEGIVNGDIQEVHNEED